MLLALALALAHQPATVQAPDPPYWQQRVRYRIHAALDERQGTLSGTQQVRYYNHSPDTLATIAFHLYLNAFRPGSRWSDADSAERRRRFNDLRDPDYGVNRVSNVRIMGQDVAPIWPYAPDSTIVRFPLPRPLAPGDSMDLSMAWAARPSTLPQRQGRRGRHYDFAQWYPRVVAYDRHGWQEHPLYPAGEFYGDFGDFLVTLDVPADQVVGATGVPMCGDPGWRQANRVAGAPIRYQRHRYEGFGLVAGLDPEQVRECQEGSVPQATQPPPAGFKRMVWEARDVHHFAMSMSPDYRYEGGAYQDIAIHVLYQPGDDSTWGGGIAVDRTRQALAWLDQFFGPYPWPQLTNVHRIEGGGTEFPMMVHDGSASLGLILHEVGHNYLMGILANNEWREGFLDEGFTSFQSSLFFEAQGQAGAYAALERRILLSDLDGWSEPTSLVSERYRDFDTYNRMIYDRAQLFYHQLRRMVGDSVMRAILRTYYERWKLRHVDEAAFRAMAEEVSGRDLSTFFGQWLHTVTLYDYEIGRIESRRAAGGQGWVTRVEVRRREPGVFPVEVLLRSPDDSVTVVTEGIGEREWVTVATRSRPREVVLNPRGDAHDWNALNDRRTRGLLGWGRAPRHSWYLDTYFTRRTRRDGLTTGVAPVLWYNDAGGVTGGVRLRSDYLGRFARNTFLFTFGTRDPESGNSSVAAESGFHVALRNPVAAYQPRTSQTLEGYRVEGRAGVAVSLERNRTAHASFGPQTHTGASIRWMTTYDTDYLDPARWDGGGFVEGAVGVRSTDRRGSWMLSGSLSLGGGAEYRNRGQGLSTDDRYDVQPYLRVSGEAVARRPLGGGTTIGVRLFGGWAESGHRLLQQRRFFLAGADPVAEFGNPFLRSRGALLAGRDAHYHMPGGGGGVRGLATGITAARLASINAELERRVLQRSRSRLFRDVRVALFADGALADGDIRLGGGGAAVADAGVGLRAAHRIGETGFETRIDLPIMVTRPSLAVHETGGYTRLRYVVSFQPAF